MENQPLTLVKWSVFLGIYLLGIFCNVPWVWGNLSVYCSSYSHNRVDGVKGEVAPWLVSLNTLGLAIGVLVCGKVRQMIGLRGSLVVGILLFNGGLYVTYFSVRFSNILLDFTLGLLPGIGMGIVQGSQYTLVVRWTDRYQGLAASSVESTCVLGSVFMNPMITFYINPDNLVPNQRVERLEMFSQTEILDRVPSSFIVYGTVSFVINCIGFLLTRDWPGDECYLISMWNKIKSRSTTPVEECSLLTKKENDKTKKKKDEENETKSKDAMIESGNIIDDVKKGNQDQGPRQVLKTRVFYTLWLTMGVADFTFIVVTTYFKAFGLLYIHDDHFLTSLGTVMCIAIAVISYIGGVAVDTFGVKDTVVAFVSTLCMISSFYYVTPSISKWLYMVVCALYGAFDFGIICLLSSCALKLWGQTYLSTNYGLLLSVCVITNTVLPPVVETILITYGWFTLFTIVSVSILLNLILCVWQIPKS